MGDKDNEVRSSEGRHEFVAETQPMRQGQRKSGAKKMRTYTDLLTNLLVNHNVDECSRDGHAVLAGH